MKKKELTFTAIFLGLLIGIVMTAANTYLGLYAGMTVSASIPAAVIAMGVFRTLLRRSSIYESNIIQTMASAGESLAAGIIFTVPALVIVGAWTEFDFWKTTLIAISGGLLGVVFMVPLRKALIVEDKTLTYPEGVACAAVLETGSSSDKEGLKRILQALGIGALIKFCSTALGLIVGSIEIAKSFSQRVFFFGSDISPALVAVGYIVGIRIALLVFLGGFIGWFIVIPMMGTPTPLLEAPALEVAWTLWSTKVRYLGVGAMIVGGIWSILSVRRGLISGLRSLKEAYTNKNAAIDHLHRNLSLRSLLGIFVICTLIIFFLYNDFTQSFEVAILSTALMTVMAFLFVAVSSYVVGLVGSSNNPVSGMTISALLGTALVFLLIDYEGQAAIVATLGVAAVVCCAACTAADCSQDLKTGSLIGASPRSQQIAQIFGILIPAFTIAPVLSLLHYAYGIGEGLKAPQATLFASLANGIFGEGSIPWNMVNAGVLLGIFTIAVDEIFLRRRDGFRLHLMPMAVGIYLPLSLSVPIFMGGLVHYLVNRKVGEADEGRDSGVLASSGFIAGEAIMGVIVALLIYLNIDLHLGWENALLQEGLSVLVLLGIAYFIYRVATRNKLKSQ